jgi:hypothetical protein
MNWMPGITLPMRFLSSVRNRSVPALAAQARWIAFAEDTLSEPLMRPYRSAASEVNGITSETAISSSAFTCWTRSWFVPRL